MQHKRFAVVALMLLLALSIPSAVFGGDSGIRNLPVNAATYMGGGAADAINAVEVAPGGVVVAAGKLPGFNPGGVNPTNLLGGGDGAIVRMASSGQSVLSITRMGSVVNDMEVNGSGVIVACGDFGVASLNSSASALNWSETSRDYTRCAIAANGNVAALSGSSIYVFNSSGGALGNWATGKGSRKFNDVAIDSASATVIETGYEQKASDLKVPFMIGRGYNGTQKWQNYDFSASALKGANLGADSEGRRVSIGDDGKLYLGAWTDGGNSIWTRTPGNINNTLSNSILIKTDNYNNPFNISGAKSLGWYGRFDPGSGSIERAQWVLTRLSDGKGNSIGIRAITADANGTVFISGDASATIQDRNNRQVAGVTVGGYGGGEPYVLIISPDFSKRLIWSPFAAPGKTGEGSPASGIGVADGVVATGITLRLDKGQRLVTHNAIQTGVGGGSHDAYVAVWENDFRLPNMPNMTTPADSVLVSDPAPTLSWTGAYATSFRVQVRNSIPARVFNIRVNAADVCSGPETALNCSLDLDSHLTSLRNGAYSWRVIAFNDLGRIRAGWQAFSVAFPATATTLNPTADAITSRWPTFSWQPVSGADQYRVVAVKSSNGRRLASPWLSTLDVCSGGSCSFSFAPTRLGGGNHTWRVIARNSNYPGNKSKSARVPFRVDKSLPPAPVIPAPSIDELSQ